MLVICIRRLLILSLLLLEILGETSRAEEPARQTSESQKWPQEVVVTVGDIRTRIDGPKMWTLSGIEFQDTVMATEDSAYGSVLTIRNVGLLGTAHFLDVPGKPGQVEKEQVNHLQSVVDGQPVAPFKPMMTLAGQSFRLERTSRIREMELETTISIQGGVLSETTLFRATGPIDLRVAYPWMYALAPATRMASGNAARFWRRARPPPRLFRT